MIQKKIGTIITAIWQVVMFHAFTKFFSGIAKPYLFQRFFRIFTHQNLKIVIAGKHPAFDRKAHVIKRNITKQFLWARRTKFIVFLDYLRIKWVVLAANIGNVPIITAVFNPVKVLHCFHQTIFHFNFIHEDLFFFQGLIHGCHKPFND